MKNNTNKVDNNKQQSTKHKETLRAIKYLFFTASAGLVQVLSFSLLNEICHLKYWIAYFIALVLSVIWNFTFNRKFTFKSAANVPIAMLKVTAYYVVFTPLSILWGDALEKVWNEYLVLAFTMIINFVTEFLFYRFFVFGKNLDNAKKKTKKTKSVEDEANLETKPINSSFEQKLQK